MKIALNVLLNLAIKSNKTGIIIRKYLAMIIFK